MSGSEASMASPAAAARRRHRSMGDGLGNDDEAVTAGCALALHMTVASGGGNGGAVELAAREAGGSVSALALENELRPAVSGGGNARDVTRDTRTERTHGPRADIRTILHAFDDRVSIQARMHERVDMREHYNGPSSRPSAVRWRARGSRRKHNHPKDGFTSTTVKTIPLFVWTVLPVGARCVRGW